jgi:DNA-binding NarL/FixJ family response regulator
VDEDIPSIDSLFDVDDYQQEIQYFLLIGKYTAYKQLSEHFPQGMGYELIHAGGPEDATLYLMEKEIMIVFIDLEDERLNPISISNSLKTTNPHVRIVIISPRIKSKHLSDIYNLGSITGFLETPFSSKSLMKVISEQEARYSIDKMVTSFVQEPPKLSKASFLLLDPSLTFDEGAPINFVGLMIVSHTVPKYTQWFEETLSQDEYLLAGYLSSITALGNDLFSNQEALREINFGGISVIFRFHDNLQFSFLVKNLTKHNFESAEERISKLVTQIVEKYGDTMESGFLSEQEEQDLEILATNFDLQDEEGVEVTEEIESIFSMPESIVLLYGNNEFQQQYLIKELIKLNSEETDYDTMNLDFNLQSTTNEDEAIEIIRNKNCDVLLIDTNLTQGRSPDDFADFTKEMKPLISVIILESHEYASETLVSAINNDTIEFMMPSDDSPSEIMNHVLKGIIRSRSLADKSIISDELENSRDSFTIAKMKLRENLESFDQEEQPILHGLIITLEMRQIYDRFWEEVEFDKEMVSGLIESLKNVGGEMFTEEEKIDGLELGGTTIFVREQLDYLFIYFVKNVSPNTSVVIAKEVDTVTKLFADVIDESSGIIPVEELHPFFDKIAVKAHYSFTEILSEIDEENLEEEDLNVIIKDEPIIPEDYQKTDTPEIKDEQVGINEAEHVEKIPTVPQVSFDTVPDLEKDSKDKMEIEDDNVEIISPVSNISIDDDPSDQLFQRNEVNLSENAKRFNIPGIPTPISETKAEDNSEQEEELETKTEESTRPPVPGISSVPKPDTNTDSENEK